jgi:hypothetical protein
MNQTRLNIIEVIGLLAENRNEPARGVGQPIEISSSTREAEEETPPAAEPRA